MPKPHSTVPSVALAQQWIVTARGFHQTSSETLVIAQGSQMVPPCQTSQGHNDNRVQGVGDRAAPVGPRHARGARVRSRGVFPACVSIVKGTNQPTTVRSNLFYPLPCRLDLHDGSIIKFEFGTLSSWSSALEYGAMQGAPFAPYPTSAPLPSPTSDCEAFCTHMWTLAYKCKLRPRPLQTMCPRARPRAGAVKTCSMVPVTEEGVR